MNDVGDYLLLIEDEPSVQENNMKILQRRGYRIRSARTLAEARAIVAKEPPRAIILDLHLPDGNGLVFLQELRKTSDIPVLILTALGTPNDIIRGFDMGSDDYLTKPYDLHVFLIRIEALLRRASAVPEVVVYGGLRLYPASGRALLNGRDMLLSQKEYSLLQQFVQNPGKILGNEFLYTKVWGQKMTEEDKSLKVAISKLRSKLAASAYTVTASRGEGYYLEQKNG